MKFPSQEAPYLLVGTKQQESLDSMVVYIKLLLTAVFWGGTFIAGRALAGRVAPFSAAFLRFAVASAFLLLFLLKADGRIPRIQKKQVLPIFILGLTGVCAYNFFFFKGLERIEAGRAAVIIANNPVFIALFSALLFKERLTRLQLLGILLSVSGAMLVVLRGNVALLWAGGFGQGELFIFGCVLSWVTFSLVGKSVLTTIPPLTAIFFSAVAGSAMLFGPAVAEGLLADISRYSPVDWLSIFYLGFFGTAAGFVWYYDGIKAIGPTNAGLFINFVPISAIVMAFFLLGEPLTASLFIGTLLVVTGVFFSNKHAGRDQQKAKR
jgi:drug/metabolite transporter (DMT)-like permease